LQAQQKLQQQTFEQATAQKQAEITRIQAQATADQERIVQCGGHIATTKVGNDEFQTIVPNAPDNCTATGLTQAYLQYAYIQALNNIATSGTKATLILPNGLSPVLTVPTGGSSGQ
jgi:regulator of protease activity HflC (stomatin/prohibitin superfamily)